MNERDQNWLLDAIQYGLKVTRVNNRIEVMWDPSLADPEIHLAEEDLDEFLRTFSGDEKGRKIKAWIEGDAVCERNIDGETCKRKAVGSIDFYGGFIEDSVLVCREDVRPVYGDIMDKLVRLQGFSPYLTINRKEVPRPEPQK